MGCDFEALLFDMDGLLLDTEGMSLSVLSATVEKAGFVWSAEVGRQLIGRNAQDGDEVMRQHYGFSFDVKQIRQNFIQAYEQHIRNEIVPHKAGAESLLKVLQSKQVLRALVTSSRRRLTDLKLAKSGLAKYFPVQICGDEISRGKPDPEGYLLAAEKLGVEPDKCLVLEDSMPGIRAAIAAGMSAAWIPDQHAGLVEEPANGVLRFSDLLAVQQHLFH